MTTRKSPTDSATLFPIGKIKTGNDGNKWVVSKTSTGVKRWVPLKSINVKFDKKENIIYFELDDIINLLKKKPKKIGSLEITSNKLATGDDSFIELPGKKGTWNIYSYFDSLLAIHEDETLNNQKYTLTKEISYCSRGLFAFMDAKRIKTLSQETSLNKKKRKSKSKEIIFMPEFDSGFFSNGSKKYLFEKDFIDKNLIINTSNKVPLGIFIENGFGDGGFPVFKGQNSYIIQSENLYDQIVEHK